MEPHINHERPGWRGAWLQDRCHQGFEVPEAECLCLRTYYRIDGIQMLIPNYQCSAPIYDYVLGEVVFPSFLNLHQTGTHLHAVFMHAQVL